MTQTSIDATELRLLSNILALVLDEQPGASTAALETLRRRAAANRVTGGALKNLFDRIATEGGGAARPPREDVQRLQMDLDTVSLRASRLAAENAALHQRLAEAERNWRIEMRLRQSMAGPLPPKPPPRSRYLAGVLAGAVLMSTATLLSHDRNGPLGPHRILPRPPAHVLSGALPLTAPPALVPAGLPGPDADMTHRP